MSSVRPPSVDQPGYGRPSITVVSTKPSSPIDCCQSANCPSRPRTSSSTAAGPAPKARASAAASARTSSSRSSRFHARCGRSVEPGQGRSAWSSSARAAIRIASRSSASRAAAAAGQRRARPGPRRRCPGRRRCPAPRRRAAGRSAPTCRAPPGPRSSPARSSNLESCRTSKRATSRAAAAASVVMPLARRRTRWRPVRAGSRGSRGAAMRRRSYGCRCSGAARTAEGVVIFGLAFMRHEGGVRAGRRQSAVPGAR